MRQGDRQPEVLSGVDRHPGQQVRRTETSLHALIKPLDPGMQEAKSLRQVAAANAHWHRGRYDPAMTRGLGTTQRAILGEVKKLPIEAYPRGIPVVDLAERLGCSERQVRRAAHSLAERDLVALVKTSRPGRQGQTLEVWDRLFRQGWVNFIYAPHGRNWQAEINRREYLTALELKKAARRKARQKKPA